MAGKIPIKNKKKLKVELPLVEAKQLDHVLVPKVEVATTDDLKDLLDNFGISIDKLPQIKSSDPAIAFLKLKAGDVVKFSRKSLVTGGQNPYYRLVLGE
ncbi:MAG: DNA-directed RNA polymerase subunit RpoH/Rpb5 C-terminal domain-containing protein [Candidatus Micrarchaeota archaeon]|nr:DNA-directed RNA polymerase subunit RpoH/Rpb5 C-terminal domain-containing protein [Candidatus Micrarchaeota archaeon]